MKIRRFSQEKVELHVGNRRLNSCLKSLTDCVFDFVMRLHLSVVFDLR